MTAEEFWVFRIIANREECRELHGTNHPQVDAWNKLIASGDICYVNGDLVEPIEVYEGVDAQERATERALVEASKHPGKNYKVVLNAEL